MLIGNFHYYKSCSHISEQINYTELHLNFAGKVKQSSCQRRYSAYLDN
jgi:hypothetical protein